MFQPRLLRLTKSTQRTYDSENNSWHGDVIPVQKPDATIRLMFHNVHNIPLNGTNGFDSFIHTQTDLNIDIQGFSEHCLDTTKFRVIQQAQKILYHTCASKATLQLNSSQEPAPNVYKPGGTGILTIGEAVSRLEPRGKGGDSMGRWSYMSFRRKHFPPVTVISIYQVCPRPTNILGNTSYHQQHRALAMQDRHVHPRQAFIEDLQQFVESLLNQNHDLILGGDFNEALTDKNSGILKLATKYQLVDPFTSKFPNNDDFGTHLHGKRRIDSVLMTPALLPGVSAIGYAPYDYASPSDHRPILLDFKFQVFFGTDPSYMVAAPNRILKTKDKTSVKTYINALYSHLSSHHAFHILTSIQDDTATPETVEYIDELLGKGEDIAEKACRKRRPEYYSQTIVRQRFEVAILKQHLRALQQDFDRTQQLRQKMDRTGIHVDLPVTSTLTRQALKAARTRLCQTRQTSFETRHAEIDKRIQELSEKNHRAKQKVLTAIRKVEASLHTFRVLKAMKKSNMITHQLDRLEIPASWPPLSSELPSLDTLEDPKTCQEWRLITDPNEIEFYLLLRNRLHFGQASGTPFTMPELTEAIDWQASTNAAEEILAGSYTSVTTNPEVQTLLQACKAAAQLDTIPHELTYDEFKGKITSWRESTTTSPSGRHLGRYKALFQPVPEVEDNPTISFAAKQETLAHFKLALINYCIRNTYVLDRWKTIVNVMLFKEEGNDQIHRLRVIHLYEADFNALLAVKWRRLLHVADSSKLINQGQYGGRPGCEAQSLPFLEELKYDLSHLTRRSLFNFDNDAASCYDRIVVSLASLINRKYGQHRRIVALHAKTLQTARFHMKTNNGISTSFYTHTAAHPIHGTGQGSGNSPCIWLFISSTLFDIHASQALGSTFVSPCGRHKVTTSMVGFVDDSTGTSNDFQPQTQSTLEEMSRRMQKDAQLWSDLLHCTGGKLELTKCSFHCLHFEFAPNGTPTPIQTRLENQIHIRDATTTHQVPIYAKTVTETHRTLGHHKAPVIRKHNLSILESKAAQISMTIIMSPITRQGAALAYHSIFIPTIRYTLPQSYYPRSLLEKAQSLSLTRIIAKCGFNRHTARAILFAPPSYAGGGFLPWHLLQGEGQTTNFLKHWRTDTVVSSMLRMTVCWAQWQSGQPFSILSEPSVPLHYLECRWLQSLRSFLSETEAKIQLDHTFVVPSERSGDVHIMSYACNSRLFTSEDLRIINYCRLYLHVTTVSELLEADGRTINHFVYQCQREPWFDPSTYVTLQQRPNDFHVRTKWQRLCRHFIQSSGQLAESLNMGKWTVSGEQLRRRRPTYITTSSTPRVYQWRRGQYWEYTPSATHPLQYTPTQPTTWAPNVPCQPVHAKLHSSGLLVLSKRLSKPHPRTTYPRPPTSFHQYASTLTHWEQHLLLGIDFKIGPFTIFQQLISDPDPSPLMLVSDGSQIDTRITYGWVLGNRSGNTYAEHSGYGYGTPTSHRAEAWGILSGVVFIHHLQVFTGLKFQEHRCPTLPVFSDNSGLIQGLQQRTKYKEPYPNSTLSPDWDLLEQTYQVTSIYPPDAFEFTWVRGHQDQENYDLPPEAEYNVRADYLASTVVIPPNSPTATAPWILPAEKCTLIVRGESVHAHYLDVIRQAYTLPPLLAYLTSRHGWDETTPKAIDWQAYKRAVSMSTIPRVQLTKLIFNKLPTRYERSKANRHLNPSCPFCDNIDTFRHCLQCENPDSQAFRKTIFDHLDRYFKRHNVPPRFQSLFRQSLTYIVHPSQQLPASTRLTKTVHTSQSAIGWELLMKGFLSIHWRKLLHNDMKLHGTSDQTTPSLHIIAGLITLLWQSQYTLWQDICNRAGSSHNHQSLRSLDQKAELGARIRLLHSKRPLCLHHHRDIYFHADVESFLSTSTVPQLKQYLSLYEPVIDKSIKDAQEITTRPLLSFIGFTAHRTRRRYPVHQTIHEADRPTTFHPPPSSVPPAPSPRHSRQAPHPLQRIPTKPTISHPDKGNFPHKHSRWKDILSNAPITRYFTKSKPHHPD